MATTGGRLRLVLLRVLLVGASALVALGALGALLVGVAYSTEWRLPPQPELGGPTVVTDRNGNELVRFTAQVDRREVDLDEVAPAAVAAVVASEDAGFYGHTGVDPLALVRAVVANVRTGGITQGGSTLTQQYVKNAFTGDDLSLRRKVEEAVLSIQLERELDKDEILERYLNTVFFGEGASGVEAAARTYFGVAASDLTLGQGATLAQLLPAPSVRNPRADPDGARLRRDRLLRRMGELGVATRQEVREALDEPLEVRPRPRSEARYPFVVQHVRRLLVDAYGEQAVLSGGLRVRTTVDPDAMAALDRAVAEVLPLQPDRPGVDAGAMAVDPRSGQVLAWYGGRDHATSAFDLALQSRRRPGSTFKPITALAALESGSAPDEPVPAPARWREGELCDPGWAPSNADGRGYGALPLDEALVRSVNTALAHVGCEVGADALADTAARLGVRSDLAVTPQLAIGGAGSNSTVADLAQVYATLANDGVHCPLRTVLEVTDADGLRLDPPQETDPRGRPWAASKDVLAQRPDDWSDDDDDGCHRVADADDVRTVNAALEQVVARTTGRRADVGRPQAGKTGTTDDEVDAWFAGYTPDLALVVRVGDDDEVPLSGVAGFDSVQGGTVPALVWAAAAGPLLQDVDPTPFPRPGEEQGEEPTRVRVPATRPSRAPAPSPTPTPDATPSPGPASGTAPPTPDDPGQDDPDGQGGDGGDDGQDDGQDDGGDDDGGDGCTLLIFCDP